MNALRTPPKLAISASQHASSESDISILDPEKSLLGNARRPKRPRNDAEVKSDDTSLKQEILEMLSQWKKEQDVILNKLCTDISELKQQNTSIKSSSDELEKSLKFISLQYDDMKIKLLDMERERNEQKKHILNLETKLEDIQKRLKFTAIEFRNIPHLLRTETQQDLSEAVQKICKSFNADIQQSDINDIFKITNNKGITTVVANFTSYLTKNRIMDCIKDFNRKNFNNKLSSVTIGLPGPAMPIYVTESLTKNDRKLYALTREASKNLAYKYCWAKRGKIFVKKTDGGTRREIKNEADVAALKIQ